MLHNVQLRGVPDGVTLPRMKYPNNLLKLRKAAGLTQADIAKVWGVERGDVSRIEKGNVSLSDQKRKLLTQTYGWSASDIYGDSSGKLVPVLGYVGGGERIFPVDDLPIIKGFSEHEIPTTNCDFVEAPPGGVYGNMVALRVKGDSMEPFLREGSIVYYHEIVESGFDRYLNAPVVVCLKDGSMYVKVLKRGFGYGRYNLQSTNTQKLIEDVELQWCAKVAFTKPV